MRLEHLLSGEDAIKVGFEAQCFLLLMFIYIEKDEAERMFSDSLKPVL